MIYQRGHLARPLDAILSAASRLAVLRQLHGVQEGRGGRLIARLAGINHQSAALALADLAKHGIVERRQWGSQVLWRLDRRRWLVTEVIEPFLHREAEHAEEVAALIKKRLKGLGRGVLLHGRLPSPERRISLGIVGGGAAAANAIRALAAELRERFSLTLEGRVIGENEALRLAAFEDVWRLLPDEGPGWAAKAR